jgi:hypothetical protein
VKLRTGLLIAALAVAILDGRLVTALLIGARLA